MQALSSRLKTAAQFARAGLTIADIGTDHAYLPIYLVQKGTSVRAIASDIAEGPLESARKNVERAGLSGLVELRLGSGLSTIGAHDADDIFICGMGGLVISEIIAATPWLKNGGKRLVLQPMTKAYELRKFLFSNGYDIKAERAVRDAHKVYTVMCAEYSGEIKGNELLFYAGRLDPVTDGCANDYLRKVCMDISNKIIGAAAVGDSAGEARLISVRKEIERLITQHS